MKAEEVSEKKRIHYVKLHVPWQTMCKRAEDLNLRVPLQVPVVLVGYLYLSNSN